jgi:hypothetical protein
MTFQVAFPRRRRDRAIPKHQKQAEKRLIYWERAATLEVETGTRQRLLHADEPLTINSERASRVAPAIVSGRLHRPQQGATMPIDPEVYSELTNALQAASLLAGQRAVTARAEAAEADQLFAAVSRAVEAARQLRSNGGEQS